MTETPLEDDEELSLFAIGALLLRARWQIVRWAVGGVFVALAIVIGRPKYYVASASFIPQGTDPGRSGLADLAGQFGVSVSNTGQGLTPEFYVRLLKSRELLGRISRDTFVVPELSRRRAAFADLFKIGNGSLKLREELGVRKLSELVGASASKQTGVIEFTVKSEWPSVSLAVATSLVNGVNAFNQRTRRDQAAAERHFVEGRLAVARSELRYAEDRLEQFLKENRQFGSPELSFARDRLQRDVALRQDVFNALTQSYEEVRMREVRDTPVITIVDPPSVPTMPEPRGRLLRVLLGFVLGAFLGAGLILIRNVTTRRLEVGDTAAEEFVAAIGDLKGAMPRLVRRLRARAS